MSEVSAVVGKCPVCEAPRYDHKQHCPTRGCGWWVCPICRSIYVRRTGRVMRLDGSIAVQGI